MNAIDIAALYAAGRYAEGQAANVEVGVARNGTKDSGRIVFTEGGCWEWVGGRTRGGYGVISNTTAHRVMYEAMVGPIPDGLEIDHLCRNRACVNPDHLEPVTRHENARRALLARPECAKGHPYDGFDERGRRRCQTCSRDWFRQRHWRRRDVENARCREYGRRTRMAQGIVPRDVVREQRWQAGLPQPKHPRTHCFRGHELTTETIYLRPDGERACRICRQERGRAYRATHPDPRRAK